MRFRTLVAVTLTMFAVPAVGAELPAPPQMPAPLPPAAGSDGGAGASVCYEVRVLKVPADFWARVGVKVNGEVVLSDAELRQVLEAAQGHRRANVMQMPRVTVDNGQTARLLNCESRSFATRLEATKVNGATVLVPKNVSVEVGDTVAITGSVAADGKSVRLRSHLTCVRIAGAVELVPVSTQITPVFEGGSQGKPVAFTQFLQVPDVRTEKAEKSATVPADGTIVLGGWKETEEPAADQPRAKGWIKREKEKPAPVEYEVVVLATVRLLPVALAPMPREANQAILYKLRNVAAADAAHALVTHIETNRLPARVTFDAAANNVYVSAAPALQKLLGAIIEKLDTAPTQVVVTATVVQVPRGFAEECGLTGGCAAWALTAREQTMFNLLLRRARERGELDVLTRPQVQVADNQTGFVQVGQSAPAVVPAGGGAAQPACASTGFTLRVTPRFMPNGQLRLRAATEFTEPNGTEMVAVTTKVPGALFPVTRFVPQVTVRSHQIETTVELNDGQTMVMACGTHGAARSLTGAVQRLCGDGPETLVILTPHVVRPEPAGPAWLPK